jgi:hypothetical protein
MLVRERALQRIVKVLTQARYGQYTIFLFRLLHDFVLKEIRGFILKALS